MTSDPIRRLAGETPASRLGRAVRRGVRESRSAFRIGVLIWLTVVIVLAANGVNALGIWSYVGNLVVYACTTLVFVVPLGAGELMRSRPDHPILHLARWATSEASLDRLGRGLPLLGAQIIFMPAFSALKSSVPMFNPYTWDATFIALDRSIHGGDPWRLMQPVLGHPWITSALSLGYQVWLMLIYAGGIYFCFFVRDAAIRNRYFIAYFLIWSVIGGAMAVLFASVGPCFLGPLLGNPYFAEQMAYLYRANEVAPVLVLPVQETLLKWQLAYSHGLGSGITAMPSMHIAMATMSALAVRHVSKTAGWIFAAYAVVIFVSSVHLAYHYAVDGYVAALATLVIWWIAGRIATRRAPDRASHHPSGPRG